MAVSLGYSNSSKVVINHVDDDDKQSIMIGFGADSQNENLPTGQTKTTNAVFIAQGKKQKICPKMLEKIFNLQ